MNPTLVMADKTGYIVILAAGVNEERRELMHVADASTSEVAIFGRVLEPEDATLNVAAASRTGSQS
jgi:hypothetical protein